LTPQSTAICAEHPNIVGLKDATGDLDRVKEIRSLVSDDFLLYSGNDDTASNFVMRGGDGCISVTANVAPEQMHDLMVAALEKDAELVQRINWPLMGLHKNLFVESNPIPIKWAVSLETACMCRKLTILFEIFSTSAHHSSPNSLYAIPCDKTYSAMESRFDYFAIL
jgi:dihydrodipicolinate synthase/N-acetylneuraminate lyase